MSLTRQFALLTAFIFLLNIPFGYWRAGTRRFSVSWFLAIHVPVGIAIAFRLMAGIRFILGGLPLLVGAFALGQSLGGRLRSPRLRPRRTPRR